MAHIKPYSVKDGVIDGGVIEMPAYRNYAKIYLDCMKQYKDQIAFIDGITDEKITYNEFVQKVLNVAASLLEAGVKKGDVVAICSENRIEYMLTIFGVIYIGGIANFINSAYSKEELLHTTGISKPKFMFFSPTTYKKYYDTMKNRGFVSQFYVYGNGFGNVASFEDLVQRNVNIDSVKAADVDEDATAVIVYSSGTTGLPKGVKWLHRSLIVSTLQPIQTKQDLTALGVAPWTNTIGFLMTNQFVTKGNTFVLLSKFSERRYLHLIEKYKVGFLLAVPPLVILLSKSMIIKDFDLSSVRQMACGGSVLEAKVIEEAMRRLPNLQHVLQGYGLSEITGTLSQETEDVYKIGSVGRVAPGVIAKLVDPDTEKIILEPNKTGEVLVKGQALFGGYVGKDRGDDYDADGFYKTGDIAYYDNDGFLFIVDRIKELIKYKSWQVPPSELEAVLLQHPAVKDAAVIGVPDSLVGELPLAFVVKQPGAKVTEKELIDFVASKVSSPKRLRGGVRFIDEIPKNGSGKILRRILRDMVAKPKSKL
ncbi:hypothetical protein O0L34_g10313 [Tuta absoluta]|nr:hypothetical protein O0L34_g10313 [Tuta absoluta]